MNRFQIIPSVLAFGVLAASASAQQINMSVSGGWVINNVLDENSTLIVSNSGGTDCQTTDFVSAILDWDIRRFPPGAGSEFFRVIDSAKYAAQLHQDCVLGAVSASDIRAGHAVYTRSSTGSVSYSLNSDTGRTTTPDPHANGQLSAECTITLLARLILPPPAVKPPYTVVVSNSASVSGTGAPTFSDFSPTSGSTNNKNYFSVTASADLSSSLYVPPPALSPVTPFDVVWARPLGNSSITLN